MILFSTVVFLKEKIEVDSCLSLLCVVRGVLNVVVLFWIIFRSIIKQLGSIIIKTCGYVHCNMFGYF